MDDHKHDTGSHENKLCAMTCCPGRIDLKALKPLVKAPKSHLQRVRAGGRER